MAVMREMCVTGCRREDGGCDGGCGVVCGRLLLQGKADPDKARITDGVTPMYWAADKGHEAVVRCCGRMMGGCESHEWLGGGVVGGDMYVRRSEPGSGGACR